MPSERELEIVIKAKDEFSVTFRRAGKAVATFETKSTRAFRKVV